MDFGGFVLLGRTVCGFGGLLVSTSSKGLENVVVFSDVVLLLYSGTVVVLLVKTCEND